MKKILNFLVLNFGFFLFNTCAMMVIWNLEKLVLKERLICTFLWILLILLSNFAQWALKSFARQVDKKKIADSLPKN